MISRREFLIGAGALTVIGFDTEARAFSASPTSALQHLPELDGVVLTDLPSRTAYAQDVGNAVHLTPFAVLLPDTVEDIEKMVKFCRKYRIKVAARGQGHSTNGQSQVKGGLVIDTASLNEVFEVGDDRVTVGAGLKWSELVAQTVAVGRTPPVLTGYLGLSIGGTLSMGGISSTNRRGAQVDHVRELEVVTGQGERVVCSETNNRELFEMVLAGLGQCAIITRASIDLVPVKDTARVFTLAYADNARFFADFRRLLRRGEFDDVYDIVVPDGQGGWVHQLNAIKFFDSIEPDGSQLLRGLTLPASAASVIDVPYLQYVLRVDGAIEFFKANGLWEGVLHPWFDVFLPDRSVERFIGETLPTLTPADVGATGFMLIFPQKRANLNRPLLRVPGGDEWVFLFDILTANAVPGPDDAFEARMLSRNRRLFEKARRAGGTRYPIGSLDFSPADWAFQYQEQYLRLLLNKKRFDPSGILTPGPGIFG